MKDGDQVENENSVEQEMEEQGQRVEDWNHDSPPEDDFHDPDRSISGEDIEGVSEESYASPAVDKGRGKVVLLGLVGVAALFLGALVFMQLKPVFEDKAGSVALDSPSTLPSKTGVTSNIGLDTTNSASSTNVSALYNDAGAGTVPPSPSMEKEEKGTLGEVLVEGASDPAPAKQANLPSLPPSPVKVDKVEEVPYGKIPPVPAEKEMRSPSGGNTMPFPSAMVPESRKEQPSPEVDGRIQDLTTKVQALQESLQAMGKRNEELVGKIEALQASIPAQQNAPAVEERLAKLEQKAASQGTEVKSKNKAQPSVQRPVTPTGDAERGGVGVAVPDALTNALDEQLVQSQAVSEGLVGKAKTTTKKGGRKTSESLKKASKPHSMPVLRAATPDAAWISLDETPGELQRITVGDVVQEIGRVTEIRQKGEHWEVVGSKGTLR